MVSDIDNQMEGMQREKRAFDIFAASTMYVVNAVKYKEIIRTRQRETSVVENETNRSIFSVQFPTRRMGFGSSKRKTATYSECESQSEPQQNPSQAKKRTRRENTNYGLSRTTLSSAGFGDECVNQNPRCDHASSSPELCLVKHSKKRKQGVSNKKAPRRRGNRNPSVRKRQVVVREREETPEWLKRVMREVNGTDEKQIKDKVLSESDVDGKKTRLLIPWNGIVDMDFLNEEELQIIDEHYQNIREKGVDVILVDPRGKKWELNLRRWDMEKSSNYTLVTGWNKVVYENKIKAKETLQIWSFRSQSRLYIAFVRKVPARAMVMAPSSSSASPPLLT